MMIEAIKMISHIRMIFEIAAFGCSGYVLGFLGKFLHQWLKFRHKEKKMQIDIEYSRIEAQTQQDARGFRFPVGRLSITFSLFFMTMIALYFNTQSGHYTAIPVDNTTSLFWGLYQKTVNGIETVKAFYYDPAVFYCQTTMVCGFYFGSNVD